MRLRKRVEFKTNFIGGCEKKYIGAKEAMRLDGSLIHSSLKIGRDRLYCLVTFHVISFWKLQKQYEFVCVFVICSHHLSSLSLHFFSLLSLSFTFLFISVSSLVSPLFITKIRTILHSLLQKYLYTQTKPDLIQLN